MNKSLTGLHESKGDGKYLNRKYTYFYYNDNEWKESINNFMVLNASVLHICFKNYRL